MIEVRKSKWFDFGFSQFTKRLFHKHYSGIYLSAPSSLPPNALWCANHSSWWDGLVLHYINRAFLKHDFNVMMHEKGLKEFPYFRRLGAFSVNRENPRDTIKSVNYGSSLLKEGKTVAIFPQGDEQHLEKRPLNFMSGLMAMAEKSPETPILPIALYYSFGSGRKQEIYAEVGEHILYSSLPGSRKEKTKALEERFTLQLDGLKAKVMAGDTKDFVNLL